MCLQRATIVVHEEKVLVKTEIVKAIITPDKAVLIKGRCGTRRSWQRCWLLAAGRGGGAGAEIQGGQWLGR